jgi:saccharopine dehydrogenase-like NADP-dependent oxidoreductase
VVKLQDLFAYVLEVLEKLDLLENVIAVSADNTNTNFGGRKRKGKYNLCFKMQENTLNNLIGIGRPAHVIHNAVQTAVDCLPIDLQLIIKKIYQHFHIYWVRVEELKSFCEVTPIQSIKLFWVTARQDGSLSCLQSRELLTFFLN